PVAEPTQVVFSIAGAPADASLTRTTVTAQNGVATTTLKSGTVRGTARIEARTPAHANVGSAQTSVVIQAGPPVELVLGALPLNIAGKVYVNEKSTVSGFVYDAYHNPVPDNTTVYFTSDYGLTDTSGVTADGFFTANHYSGDNRLPPDGLVTVTGSTRNAAGQEIKRSVRVLWSGPTRIEASLDRFDLQNGESIPLTITVSDIFGNPLVGGATVSVTAEGVTLRGLASATVEDTNIPQTKTVLSLTLSDPDPATEAPAPRPASVIVRVTSRNGNKTLEIAGTTR
ncbi:MAG: hypothetical protein IT210_20655, partial [Armatimonadetes bacterium]|nr:hypothetical protein [Armatimonadota bacterium]